MPQRGANSGRGLLRSAVTADIIDRFRKHTRQAGDCWIWTGAQLNGGHGVIRVNGRNLLVHRIAYVLGHGDLRPGVIIRHKCSNRSCVRPDHLRVANVGDLQRERLRNVPPYVHQIRESYVKGYEYWEIAPAFGRVLTPLQVRSIALNKCWVDVNYSPRPQIRRKPDTRRKLDDATIVTMQRRFKKGSRTNGVAAIARDNDVSYSVAWEAVHGQPSHRKRLQTVSA